MVHGSSGTGGTEVLAVVGGDAVRVGPPRDRVGFRCVSVFLPLDVLGVGLGRGCSALGRASEAELTRAVREMGVGCETGKFSGRFCRLPGLPVVVFGEFPGAVRCREVGVPVPVQEDACFLEPRAHHMKETVPGNCALDVVR